VAQRREAKAKNRNGGELGFEAIHAELDAERTQDADPEGPDEHRGASIFWAPTDARWSHLEACAPQPTIGTLVDEAMHTIERENPSLEGVPPAGNANFARVPHFIHRLDPKGFPIATG
jgi:type I restriction-modification system DNA methylase subunit